MAKITLICLYDNWALGLRTLSNALISNGHEVSIVNFKLYSSKQIKDFLRYPLHYENVHSNNSFSEMILNGYGVDVNMWTHNEVELLVDLLKDINPDIIGFSTRSIYESSSSINSLMEKVKNVSSAITIAGGFGSTFNPAKYANIFDYACVGEGEDALIKVAECVNRNRKEDIKKISNLVYKEKDEVIFNKLEPLTDSEDYWFSPSMEKVKRYVIENNIVEEGTVFIKNILDKDPAYVGEYYTMVGRGCLWDCSFCSGGRFYMKYRENEVPIKRRRLRSIECVIKELKNTKEKYHFKKIFFMDSYFTAPVSYIIEFFKVYKDEINLPFFAQFFSPQVFKNPEILKSAYEAGLSHTVVGIQSGSERLSSDIMNRRESNENLLKFANMICQYENVLLDYHLVTHNPFETKDDILETFDLLGELPKKNAQLVLNRLRAFNTSTIEKMIKKANIDTIKNMDRDKINFVLYLIRFYTSNEAFEAIKSQVENYSYEDLRNIYAKVRGEYDCNFSSYSRINSSGNPVLIEEYKDYNILLYKREFLAFSQTLGPVDFALTGDSKLIEYKKENKIFIENSIDKLKQLIDEKGLLTLPQLVMAGYKGFNIVSYKDKYYAINLNIGKIDISTEQDRLKKYQKENKCFIGSSTDEIKQLLVEF